MLVRLAHLANYFLQRDIAGRALYKLPDDAFLVAYPGSGGQWLRRLVANLLDPANPVSEGNVQSRLPDLYHGSRHTFAELKSPRIIFSHECFEPESRRAVYLVRDPRDVVVSFHERARRGGSIGNSLSLEQFVSVFFMKRTDEYQGGWAEEFCGTIKANKGFSYRSRLKDEFLGTPASWGENVMSWVGARGRDPNAMLLLRYEDLVSDPAVELGRIAGFLGLDGSAQRIQSAVRITCNQLTPEPPGKWKTVLPESVAQEIESAWGPVMTAMGYALEPVAVGR